MKAPAAVRTNSSSWRMLPLLSSAITIDTGSTISWKRRDLLLDAVLEDLQIARR